MKIFTTNLPIKLILIFISFIIRPAAYSQIQLAFTGTPTVSGTVGAVNSTYTYDNVGTSGPNTIRAVVTILSITGSAVLQNIDATTGGTLNAWQPIINGPVTPSGNCWGMEFSISFFKASDNSPLTLSSFRASAIDDDGDNGTLREFDEFRLPTSYTVDNPTSLGLVANSGVYTFNGPQTSYAGISLTQTNVAVTCLYNNRQTFSLRLGACCVGGSCSATGTTRQYSINFFDAVPYASSLTVLPVNFVSLNGQPLSSGNKLTWLVADESNVAAYEVERSSDGQNYASVGTVPYKTPTAPENEYSFVDPVHSGDFFYRIKSVDNDQTYKYSRIIKLNRNASANRLSLMSNPIKDKIEFEFSSASAQDLQVRIVDNTGRVLSHRSMYVQAGTNTLRYDGVSSLSRGIYFLMVKDGNGKTYEARVLKQ